MFEDPEFTKPHVADQKGPEDGPEAILLPNLPGVFMRCLFLSHLFSLFFQKRKSSSSVQLMVSVRRLPNTGKCWASDPRSLAPASLLQAAQEPGAGRECLGHAWYVCIV